MGDRAAERPEHQGGPADTRYHALSAYRLSTDQRGKSFHDAAKLITVGNIPATSNVSGTGKARGDQYAAVCLFTRVR
jgi:hypothetical protein